MRSWWVLVVLVVVFGGIVSRQVPGFAEALPPASTSSATPADTVAGVSFDGRGLPLAQLRDAIATRAGDSLDVAQLGRDRDTIHALLISRGYLDAAVAAPEVTRRARGAFVSFVVKPGALYHVGHVRVVGAAAPAGRTLVITLVPGDEALATAIDAARAQVAAAATVLLHLDRTASVVDVDLIAP